ncbi:DoxX family protein [Nocardia sp. BSTN01]|uniref:DoxX family protein n=1 Tax=Nocardia sp. BSTN01 TaxID=2783665 RepID=UPI00188FEA4C|nr:DoxX family protein [Nocardia sp. BSTN01]MBF5001657.1 DoxX family protein [Nocardia sp. BSTN01]
MHTAYLTVTIVAAVVIFGATVVDIVNPEWVRGNMRSYGVPDWALMPLAAIKAAGALGLLAGLVFPALGLAAAVGLVLYFVGAVITIVRARWYAHLPYPMPCLVLASAAACLVAFA